jgi:hypothetical protein
LVYEISSSIIFIDNIQLLFNQMNPDLPELRSILHEHGGASGSTSGNGNAGNGGIAIGVGSVADGTSGKGNGNGHGGGVAINGGHTHQGCTDAIGKMCLNPP